MRCLSYLFVGVLAGLLGQANPALDPALGPAGSARLRFEVGARPGLLAGPADGRLILVLGRTNAPEPRTRIGDIALTAEPVLGTDVTGFDGRRPARLDATSALFPLRHLRDLPAGDYWVQAVLATNRDFTLLAAPGNLFSAPQRVRLDPTQRPPIRVNLDQREPDEVVPADTESVKFLKLRSEKLSQFWGRPMFLRAGIVLPRGWADEPTRRYPLVIRIGGFGTRYTTVQNDLRAGGELHAAWSAADSPRFVLLQLDGAGPLGDPYQIDSANHGPWGSALLEELLPYVEATWRCVGQPHARFTTGGSTGGWVALALQVLYPDHFGGCWSGYPDPPDFRALQLVNLYADPNAYVNAAGFDRASAREINGETKFTIRLEIQLENVLGRHDSFTYSGGQWGSWNATYSPRDAAGRPAHIWDPRTGQIDPAVAAAWRRYDLRDHLAQRWAEVGPKLRGKIHLWMGDADTYFLDTAARHLDDFLKAAQPPADARLEFGPRQPHGWEPRPWGELLREMQAEVDRRAPRSAAANHDYLRARFGHGAATCPVCRGGR
jgi:S-formylglutathione hydrolase FrmB